MLPTWIRVTQYCNIAQLTILYNQNKSRNRHTIYEFNEFDLAAKAPYLMIRSICIKLSYLHCLTHTSIYAYIEFQAFRNIPLVTKIISIIKVDNQNVILYILFFNLSNLWIQNLMNSHIFRASVYNLKVNLHKFNESLFNFCLIFSVITIVRTGIVFELVFHYWVNGN